MGCLEVLVSFLLLCGCWRAADAACRGTQDVCGIETENGTQVVYFLSLLPYPNADPRLQPSFDEGPTLEIVGRLAVERINNAPDILPGYTVKLLRGDGGCQIWSTALTSLFEHVITSFKQVVGVVGPGCSTSATTVAPQIGRNSTSLLCIHIAGSPLLADRSNYPYAFSTLDSTEAFAEAIIALVMNNGWENIAVLFDPDRLFYFSTVSILEQKVRNIPGYNIEVSSAVSRFLFPIDDLVGRNVRVIFLFLGPSLLNQMLCVAFHNDLIFPVYQLVFVSRVVEEIQPTSFVYDDFNYTCSLEQLAIATNHSLIVHYQVRPRSRSAVTDIGLSGQQFESLYQAGIDAYNANDTARDNITMSFWRGCFYDAVWSLALALNNSMEDIDLSQYRFGQHEASNVIRRNLLELQFNGLSGNVEYNADSGFVTRSIDIYQVTNSAMEVVAFYDGTNNSSGITLIGNATFIDGSFGVETVYVVQTLAATVVFIIVTILGFLFVAIVNILTIFWRKERPVKASSANLNQLCFIGCYFIVLAVLSLACVDGFTSVGPTDRCNLLLVVSASAQIGVTLVFGTICAKTWRLYRIYLHFTKPGRFLSDYVLFGFVLCLVFVDAVIVTLWITIDSFKSDVMETTSLLAMGSSFILRQTVRRVCQDDYYFLWFSLLSLINCSLMFVAFWLALQTRRIPHKDFRTNGVTYLVYLLSAVILFGVPLFYVLFAVLQNQDGSFIVLSLVLNAIVYCTTALLLSPPVWVTCKQKITKVEIMWTTQTKLDQ